VYPTVYAVTVSDGLSDEEIVSRVGYAASLRFERVGTVFRLDCISVRNDSGDAERFSAAASMAAGSWDSPLILESESPSAMSAALDAVKGRRPLICGAYPGNMDRMMELAKEHGCPLALRGGTLEETASMAARAKAAGIEDMVLDTGAVTLKQCLERQTAARRAAVRKKFRALGYPLMNRVGSGEYAVALASVSTMKYGSLVIFDDLKPYEALPLFTLRNNIYTDPQVPIQVKQGVYPIGSPDSHSPIMFTTNFSLTYFTVRADIEKSKIPVWLQVVNTEGLSVLTAYAAGKFDPEHVAEAFRESGILDKSDSAVIVPGLVARMSGKLEEIIGRRAVVGTNESKNIPKHLREFMSG
jgi:acetyl-CoA decarbonylase/synthase complex subunit gamma